VFALHQRSGHPVEAPKKFPSDRLRREVFAQYRRDSIFVDFDGVGEYRRVCPEKLDRKEAALE
jgi:hypothetical protein